VPDTIEYAARESAYEILDAIGAAPEELRLDLALAAARIAPSLSDAYAAVARSLSQGTREAAAAWLAARELARRDAGARLEVDAGQLWYVSFGREYLRACLGYALCCVERAEYDEAIAQFTRLLALDADDHLQVRHALAPVLLLAGRFAEFDRFREGMADVTDTYWVYVVAYHAIAVRVPAAERKRLLKRALAANPHVPTFLLGSEALEAERVEYFSPGATDEAYAFAASLGGRLWRLNPIALRYLEVEAERCLPIS